MPDIAKCNNEKCPIKDKCFRYTCKASEFNQSYAKFFFKVKNNHILCNYFMSNSNRK